MITTGSTTRIQVPAWYAKEHDLPFELEGEILAQTEKAIHFAGRIPAMRRSHCVLCGRELTHPVSLIVGVGPICAERLGIDRSRYESMSADELLQIIGSIEFKIWIPKSVLGMDGGSISRPVPAPEPPPVPAVDFDRLEAALARAQQPEQPKPESSLPDRVERTFRELFAAKMPGYEPREPQIRMARTVAEGLTSGRHVLAEAGTGTGKSFAVLVPAIYHALNEGGPVIVSTGTIALQEQYVQKDVPFLRRVLDEPFTAVLAKGKGNYVCKLRLFEEVGRLDLLGPDPLIEWARETQTGDVGEYPDTPGPRWNDINVDDTCIGKKCPYYDSCFYFAAKRRMNDAQIVIANHHLFFADLQIKMVTGGYGGVLPKAAAVIFDEAHHLESVARDSLSAHLTNFKVPAWIRAVRKLPVLIDPEDFDRLEKASNAYFTDLAIRMEEDRQELPPPSVELGANLRAAMRKVMGALESQRSNLSEEDKERAERLLKQADELLGLLASIQRENDVPENCVLWAEREQREGKGWKVTLRQTPIDVAPILSEHLFEAYPSAVLTSATISVAGRFEHLKARLGIDRALELIVESPFDYRSNCLLYVPRPETAPNPAGANPEYHRQIAPIIEEILMKTDGRAFVLFTSYRGMQIVYDELADRLRWQVLKQGDAPRSVLVEQFKQDTHSVLFGTKTFWEGISIEGESLSCVIIDKLPFSVPSDPVAKAIAAAVERQGKSAFYEISLPEAVLHIKQGFGRLIRTKSDRGLVAILDTRIRTKPYGRVFLDSLPRARRIETLDNVEAFLVARKEGAA